MTVVVFSSPYSQPCESNACLATISQQETLSILSVNFWPLVKKMKFTANFLETNILLKKPLQLKYLGFLNLLITQIKGNILKIYQPMFVIVKYIDSILFTLFYCPYFLKQYNSVNYCSSAIYCKHLLSTS